MTDPNYTAFCLIMDRSGSMDSIKKEAEQAINRFVEDQRKLPGKATLTFVRFDDQYEQVFSNITISEVTDVKLEPRGMTALLDAVGRGVVSFGESLAAMPEAERPGKVLVAIVTDGHENSSQEWTNEKVKHLVEEQKTKWNWEFIYLGANVDAFAEANNMGIDPLKAQGWVTNTAGARKMSDSLSSYAGSYRSTGKGTWGEDDQG